MPYITVRSKITTTGFSVNVTYIDYYADFEDQCECDTIEAAMERLGASRQSPHVGSFQDPWWWLYSVGKPPHFVLNGLERLAGYKVVASNTITEGHSFDHHHFQIWTLHKKPQSSAN